MGGGRGGWGEGEGEGRKEGGEGGRERVGCMCVCACVCVCVCEREFASQLPLTGYCKGRHGTPAHWSPCCDLCNRTPSGSLGPRHSMILCKK